MRKIPPYAEATAGTHEKSAHEINHDISASIEGLQQFFADANSARYLYSSMKSEIIRYLEKLKTLMSRVLNDASNPGYEKYLFKIQYSLHNLHGVLGQWHRVVAGDPSSENKVCGLYKSHLEGARQGYKLTKRKLQRLEDLNARLTSNCQKTDSELKKYALLRDSLQKIARDEIHSVWRPKQFTRSEIIRQFIELFLSPSVVLELNDTRQILWIQGSLISVINQTSAFSIDEYFKMLMSNASSNVLCIAHENYAALIKQALGQLEIKSQISINPHLYLEPIAKFFKHRIVDEKIIKPNDPQYKPSRLYKTTEAMVYSLMQLLLYMPQQQFKIFVEQNIELFSATNGFELALNAWLQLFANLEKDRFNGSIGHNILAAMDIFLLPANHQTNQMMHHYMKSRSTSNIQTVIELLSMRSKRILNVAIKHPEDIKYYFTPGFSELFNIPYACHSACENLKKQWTTAWFYLNAHSLEQIETADTSIARSAAEEIFPMFSRLHQVWPEATQQMLAFFVTIAGYGNWQHRQQLAKAFVNAFEEIERSQQELSVEYLQSLQAKTVVKLFDLPTMLANTGIFKQLASKYLLHFCELAQIDKLLELEPSLQPYRDMLQFPLQKNFDIFYYFADKFIHMKANLATSDGIWAMKLLYHVFAQINGFDDMENYAEHVNDMLESVQRFSQFYHRSAVDMPSRVLQGFDDFYLWQLEMPSEYATNSPLSFGQVMCAIQGNEINYKLLDAHGKVLNGKLQATELGIQLPANAELSDLMRAKEAILAAIASKESDLGWQALLIKQYLRLKDTVREQILAGFVSMSDLQAVSLADKIRDTILIIDGARNYKFSIIDSVVSKYLDEGLTAASIEQDITLFFDAMVAAIAKALARQDKTLTDWSDAAHSVDDRIKFICARKKYSESQFKTWFLDMNTQLAADKNTALMGEYLPRVRNLNETQQTLFTSLGIDFLQYNQEIAMASVYQHLANVKDNSGKINLFMKLGTGQGKSLVIAESARKILAEKIANKVMIFTCYDHLAERDFNKFQSYFEHFGYKAAVILPTDLDPVLGIAHTPRSHRLTGLSDVQIIYVNLETYIALLRQERAKRIKGQNTQVVFPDVRDSVAIMDEFDSLVLDSDEIGQILDRFIVPSANLLALGKSAAERKLLADLDSTGIVKSLLRTATGMDAWQSWYNRQWDQLVAGGRRFSDVSSLGKSNHFKSALLDEYPSGRVTLLGSVIDPLTFYNSFKFVIGLSGSITKQTHELTTKVLTGNSNYLEIPPFFGPINAEKNRLQTKELICDSQTQHVQRIVDEAILVHQTERPVLIFAESVKKLSDNQSDFEALKSALRACDALSDNKLLFIESEFDIKRHLPSIGKRKYVTLATRILARGADIKVDTEVVDGLHLVVGYYPDRESIYIQMLGRTARQDDKGSYAVITRSKADFKPLNSSTDVVDGICHQVSEAVFNDEKLPQAEQTGRQHLQAFPLFLTALRASSSATLQGKERTIESATTRAFPKLRG